jgi:hypothetical protein
LRSARCGPPGQIKIDELAGPHREWRQNSGEGALILPAQLNGALNTIAPGGYDSLAGIGRQGRLQLCISPLGSPPECLERLSQAAAKPG